MPLIDSKLYDIPSKCSQCGYIFLTGTTLGGKIINDGVENPDGTFSSIRDPSLWGNTYPCKKCGYPYNKFDFELLLFVEESVTAFQKVPLQELISLESKIKNNFKGNLNMSDFIQIKNDVSEVTPELKKFSDLMPRTRNEAYAAIGLVLTAIGLVIAYLTLGSGEKPTAEKIINETNITINYSLPTPTTKAPTKKKLGRNDKCHCGSGEKFKNCHWKE